MPKLSMLVSPGLWDLLERLRPHLDVTIDIFDAELLPLLPPHDEPLARVVRAVASGTGTTGSDDARERLLAAIQSGHHQLLSHDVLRLGVFPLRHDRAVVGLLVAAVDSGSRRLAEAVASAGTHTPDAIDRHVERVGWSLRAAVEGDITTREQLGNEQRLALWLGSLLRFFSHMHECVTPETLFEAVVHAAAIWGDFDTRLYRRQLDGQFRVAASLPSPEHPGPECVPASLVDGHAGTTRVTSIAELEVLGWQPAAELLLVPVPPLDPPQHLLAIAGHVDPRFEQVFGVIAETLGSCLEHLAAASARQLHERLVRRMANDTLRFPALATALIGDVASVADASSAALWLQEVAGSARLLASIGSPAAPEPLPDLPHDAALLSPGRLVLPLAVGGEAPGYLDLTAAPGAPFDTARARLAEAGGVVLEVWLAGALRGIAHASGSAPASPPRFEARIREELARASRFGLEAALVVIGTPDAGATAAESASDLPALVDAVRAQLRSSDLLGRLENGDLAALLVHTDRRGATAAVDRIERALARLEAHHGAPHSQLGLAAYPTDGDTATALIATARRAAHTPTAS
ncbi:MAG: diguanylate cyclase [Vicinamibacteraceae bacterium]|nr:diguanylate cyclase [Vicinamibacteraceae bacterium]